LSIHALFWLSDVPDSLSVRITYLDCQYSDENLVICISDGSRFSALINFSARHEPATGVYESLEFFTDRFTSRIDNFKVMRTDLGHRVIIDKCRRKSAGHAQAINQPNFSNRRSSAEFLLSELLLADLRDMISSRTEVGLFNVSKNLASLLR
jgi:hypothetical protein